MGKNKINDGPGPSKRQLRVGELIRRTLSDILLRGDIHDPDLNRMSVIVGEVSISPDLKIATIYACPLGGSGGPEMITLLAKNKHEIRRAISQNLTLKYMPDLRFRLDETFDRMDETRRLMSQNAVRRDLEDE